MALLLAGRTAADAYRIAMTSGDFNWGSNSQAARCSMLLLAANALAPDPRFTNAKLENPTICWTAIPSQSRGSRQLEQSGSRIPTTAPAPPAGTRIRGPAWRP
ncbi:MAG TPA: hypothetical protein VGK29_07130 [Paludibaculum sp.]|jgi:hypothetical protein